MRSDQLAAAAVKALPLFEKEAKKRQVAAGGDRKSAEAKEKSVPQLFAEPINAESAQEPPESKKKESESREQAAKQFGTNRQYVSDMKKLKDERPDDFETTPEPI